MSNKRTRSEVQYLDPRMQWSKFLSIENWKCSSTNTSKLYVQHTKVHYRTLHHFIKLKCYSTKNVISHHQRSAGIMSSRGFISYTAGHRRNKAFQPDAYGTDSLSTLDLPRSQMTSPRFMHSHGNGSIIKQYNSL